MSDVSEESIEDVDSYDKVRKVMKAVAKRDNHHAGMPIPVSGEQLIVHPGLAFANAYKEINEIPSSTSASDDKDPILEEEDIRNSFWSKKLKTEIISYNKKNGKVGVAFIQDKPLWYLEAHTASTGSAAWTFEQEIRALALLSSLTTEHQYKTYLLTGIFIETSKRSKIIYMFRKLRPTVVMAPREDGKCKPLCALCMHPLAYYQDSYAGALCPTDDVIAHLLLMRADEHRFWKVSTQHQPYATQAAM